MQVELEGMEKKDDQKFITDRAYFKAGYRE